MMTQDVKKVSAWFGYQRNIKYSMFERAKSFEELNEKRWDVSENVSQKGKDLMKRLAVVLEMKRKIDKLDENDLNEAN
jgi:hypothetical protein